MVSQARSITLDIGGVVNRSLPTGLRDVERRLREVQNASRDLSKERAIERNRLGRIGQDYGKTSQAYTDQQQKIAGLTAQIDELDAEALSLGRDQRKLSATTSELTGRITAMAGVAAASVGTFIALGAAIRSTAQDVIRMRDVAAGIGTSLQDVEALEDRIAGLGLNGAAATAQIGQLFEGLQQLEAGLPSDVDFGGLALAGLDVGALQAAGSVEELYDALVNASRGLSGPQFARLDDVLGTDAFSAINATTGMDDQRRAILEANAALGSLMTSFRTLSESVLVGLAPGLRLTASLVEGIATVVTTAVDALGPFRGIVGTAAIAVLGFAGALAIIRAGMLVYNVLMPVATVVTAAFNAVLALNPFVAVGIAILGVVAAIAALIVWWNRAKRTVTGGLFGGGGDETPVGTPLGSLRGGSAPAGGSVVNRTSNVTVNMGGSDSSAEEVAAAVARAT